MCSVLTRWQPLHPFKNGGNPVPDNESIVVKELPHAASDTSPLWIRDPEYFIAGEIHCHFDVWDKLTQSLPIRDQIMGWISKKVCVYDFVQAFKGRFGGSIYDLSFPVPRLFHNHNSCKPFAKFISKTIMDCIMGNWRSGAMRSPINCDAANCGTEQA